MRIHFYFTQKASDCGLLSEKTDYESLQQQFAHENSKKSEKEQKSLEEEEEELFNIFMKEFCRTLSEY
jgi:hypothetical protein